MHWHGPVGISGPIEKQKWQYRSEAFSNSPFLPRYDFNCLDDALQTWHCQGLSTSRDLQTRHPTHHSHSRKRIHGFLRCQHAGIGVPQDSASSWVVIQFLSNRVNSKMMRKPKMNAEWIRIEMEWKPKIENATGRKSARIRKFWGWANRPSSLYL